MGSSPPASPPASENELSRQSGESEGTASRRNDRWVAIVSVVGAFVVALASVLATVWTTDKTVNSQADQSRADFLRQQQVTAYTQYLADDIQIFNLLKYRYALLSSAESVAAAKADAERMQSLMSSLTLDLGRVEVVGSQDAAKIAFQIHAYALTADRAVVGAIKCRTGDKSGCGFRYDNVETVGDLDAGRIRFKNQSNHDIHS